jgi:hypothetical protein
VKYHAPSSVAHGTSRIPCCLYLFLSFAVLSSSYVSSFLSAFLVILIFVLISICLLRNPQHQSPSLISLLPCLCAIFLHLSLSASSPICLYSYLSLAQFFLLPHLSLLLFVSSLICLLSYLSPSLSVVFLINIRSCSVLPFPYPPFSVTFLIYLLFYISPFLF